MRFLVHTDQGKEPDDLAGCLWLAASLLSTAMLGTQQDSSDAAVNTHVQGRERNLCV